MNKIKHLFGILILIFVAGCGSKEFKKNPLDLIVKDLPTNKVFSIILNDMDVEGTFFKEYKHQYKIIETKDSIPKESLLGWYQVDETFFKKNAENMGLQICSVFHPHL